MTTCIPLKKARIWRMAVRLSRLAACSGRRSQCRRTAIRVTGQDKCLVCQSLFGAGHLRAVTEAYVEHYYLKRNHQRPGEPIALADARGGGHQEQSNVE
jgi:hypothetical protein